MIVLTGKTRSSLVLKDGKPICTVFEVEVEESGQKRLEVGSDGKGSEVQLPTLKYFRQATQEDLEELGINIITEE